MSDPTLAHTAPETTRLVIEGGAPVRATPMPPRRALGPAELKMIEQAIAYYRERNVDPGYQGPFEKLYTDAFVAVMGGGHADAVATGTSALYIAVAALDLPKGSEVLVSPITDPGTLGAIVLNGLRPRLMDSRPDSYNVGLAQFLERVGPNVTGAVIVHAAGQAVGEIDGIAEAARARGIRIVEDCSQSHGAKVRGRPIGTFGDIAAFSTMYRKAHMAGPSGGIVYARDLELFRTALAHADRGKPRWRPDFNDRDPSTYLFPALNHNTDEISCAIGCASLARLDQTIVRRLAFVFDFIARLADESAVCRPYRMSPADSPFFYPVIVDPQAIGCSKTEFAEAVRAEGIDLNADYKYLVASWPYIRPYLADSFDPPNARSIRDRSFNLYLNENYGEPEARDAVKAIVKVERHYARRNS
ncbi:MAG TPA: DegT/DnrJ/EryC1/StrS family aminotransferase [Alphaproteobacteria bacterium]|nr:DegT/DnrJ/EryC1/StrS family aminotransferase [Alphaproteobacteria bacterium]